MIAHVAGVPVEELLLPAGELGGRGAAGGARVARGARAAPTLSRGHAALRRPGVHVRYTRRSTYRRPPFARTTSRTTTLPRG